MAENKPPGQQPPTPPPPTPIPSIADLKAREAERVAAQAKEPPRPIDRLNASGINIDKSAANRAPEAPKPADPVMREPTEKKAEFTPPGNKAQPTVQTPGGGVQYVSRPAQQAQAQQQPRTPIPQPPAPNQERQPTDMQKTIDKMKQMTQDRGPAAKTFEKLYPDKGDRGPDISR